MSTVSTNASSTPLLAASPIPASAAPANPSAGAPAQSFSDVLKSMPSSEPAMPSAPPLQTAVSTTKPASAPATASTNTPARDTDTLTQPGSEPSRDVAQLPDTSANANDLLTVPADVAAAPDESAANKDVPVPSNSNGKATFSMADARAANAKILRALALTNAPAPLLVDPLAVAPESNPQNAATSAASTHDSSDGSVDDTTASKDAPSTSEQDQAQALAVPPPLQVCIPPASVAVQASFTPATSADADSDSAAAGQSSPIASSSTFDASTQPTRITVNAAAVRDRYAQTDSTPHGNHETTPDQAASTQLDPLRSLVAAMTPVDATPVAPTPTNDATLEPADSFTVRTSTTSVAGAGTKNASKSSAAEIAPSANSATARPNAVAYAPSNGKFAAQTAAPANSSDSISTSSSAAAATLAMNTESQNTRVASATVSNSQKNSAQAAAFSNDQFSVAAPVAPALSAGSADANAKNADSAFGHDRQASSTSQLATDGVDVTSADGSKAETFAANAFSAVAPGGYWTEKTSDAAPTKSTDVLNHVLDVLPKPLQATTITIKPEGYGAITIRVTPQPLDTASPWRISIRTSDASAHALLSQNVAELRQNLKGDPAPVFGSLKPALQTSATQETPMRQDSQNSKGGQRQDFEQRQRNRSRGFVFELPELDA